MWFTNRCNNHNHGYISIVSIPPADGESGNQTIQIVQSIGIWINKNTITWKTLTTTELWAVLPIIIGEGDRLSIIRKSQDS